MSGVESEIKYRLPDHARVEALLRQKGAPRAGWHFESNTLYDLDGVLRDSRRVLRLRRTENSAILTCKKPAPGPRSMKNRLERECRVEPAEEMDGILRDLGYKPCLEYEKFRAVWSLNETLIFLDILPFGYFLEMEGTPSAVNETVRVLHLSEAAPETGTYPALARALAGENACARCTFPPEQRAALGRALGCRIFTQGEPHAD